MRLRDSLVLVTGASSGVGEATARAMADRGAHALLLARSAERLDAVVADIEASGGRADAYPVDLADPDAVDAVAADVRRDVGVPDVVVNNAGSGRFLAIEETSAEDVEAMTAVPYFAAFNLTRAFAPDFLDRRSGHVVNVTSAAAYAPWPGSSAYAVARWAMRGFTRALHADFAEANVGVSLVAATTVDSPYFERNPGSRERLPAIARLFPTIAPADVADAIVDAVEHERRTVLVPWQFKWVVRLHRLFPRLVERVVVETGWRRSKQGWRRFLP